MKKAFQIYLKNFDLNTKPNYTPIDYIKTNITERPKILNKQYNTKGKKFYKADMHSFMTSLNSFFDLKTTIIEKTYKIKKKSKH